MRPKLILLNGPLAIGKSTIAQKYVDENPLALNLDIDAVRSLLGCWREQKEESIQLTRHMARAMAEVSIKAGNNVIVAWMIRRKEDIEFFSKIAKDNNADFKQIMLYTDKDDAVQRCVDRGFRPGGLLDRGGREVLVAKMYDEMMELSQTQPGEVRVSSESGNIEATYSKIIDTLRI